MNRNTHFHKPVSKFLSLALNTFRITRLIPKVSRESRYFRGAFRDTHTGVLLDTPPAIVGIQITRFARLKYAFSVLRNAQRRFFQLYGVG